MTEVDIKSLDYTIEEENGIKTERIHIRGRTESGDLVHVYNDETDSYFYVPTEQVDADLKTNDMVMKLEGGYESIRGKEMTRVYTYIPGHVPKVREDYDHYEADILFPNRFSLDTDIYGGMEIPDKHANDTPSEVSISDMKRVETNFDTRIMFCDIEVDDSSGFPDEHDAEEQVVCLTYYDTFEQVYRVFLYEDESKEIDIDIDYIDDYSIHKFDDEADMLEAFADKLTSLQPDVITGWNFKDFDAVYLINRFDYLSDLDKGMLSPLGDAYDDGWYGGKIRGFVVFDQLEGYKNLQFTELDSFSLSDVAEEELEVDKLNEEGDKIADMWQDDPSRLLEYNIRDVYLTVMLEEKQGIVQFYEEVANFVGGRISEVVDYSKAADIYVLRRVNDMFCVPSMDTVGNENSDDELEGAEVFDPATEIKDMVSVLDLASLYPMSMKTLNAGPTTKDPDGDITAPNGVNFTTEHESIISEIIDNLLEERELKKEERAKYSPSSTNYVKYDLQQRAVKVIMNTLYGILGWDRFRLYDEDVAASVTAVGREVIKFTQQEANNMGYDVIYGDTDSVMLEIEDADTISEVIERSFEVEEHINKRYDEFAEEELNVDEHFFEIEFEKVYRVFMQAGKKKRYAGHIVWKEGKQVDKLDIVGLEVQRSDYSKAAKELMEDMIEKILMGGTRDEVSNLVRSRIESMKNLEYELDELGIPGGIGQAFHKYSSKTKHVRAAEYANEYFGEEIQPGDKPKGIYVERIIWKDDNYPQPPQLSDSAFICWMNSNNVPDGVQIDWDKYLDIQVTSPLSRVIECTEWSWGEIISGQEQTGVMEFSSNTDNSTDIAGFGDDLELDSNEPKQESTLDDFEEEKIEQESSDGIEVMSKDEIVEAASSESEEEESQSGLNQFS